MEQGLYEETVFVKKEKTMGSPRDYMREYMQRRRRCVSVYCACGQKAGRISCGSDGICNRCWELEQKKEVLCRRQYSAKWEEAEPETSGARFWRRKLEFWLPNASPGWGSLDALQEKLNQTK